MSKHDEARRAFLKGAAAGAGALAGTGLAPQAMAAKPHKTAAAEAEAPAQMRMGPQGHGAFFNDEDAATVMAFTERLMPGAPGMPGARDAGVQPAESDGCRGNEPCLAALRRDLVSNRPDLEGPARFLAVRQHRRHE